MLILFFKQHCKYSRFKIRKEQIKSNIKIEMHGKKRSYHIDRI